MKFLNSLLNKRFWRSVTFLLPLMMLMLVFQQCVRVCTVKEDTNLNSATLLPYCTSEVTVNCINQFKSCGNHLDSTSWYEDTTELSSVNRTCKYGDVVTDQYVVQQEYTCKDGVTEATPNKKNGDVKVAGQCSSVPFNCGTHLDSTTWWEPATDKYLKYPRECTVNSEAYNYYNYENEYSCTNGTISPTNKTRLTNLAKVDNCSGEVNCGLHTDGSTWFEPMGSIPTSRTCNDNDATPVVDTYEANKEYKCVAGNIVQIGTITKGSLLTYAACPGTTSCLNHNDGEVWKEDTNEEISEKFICSDRLTEATTRYRKTLVKECNNGVTSTKETIKSSVLSIGSCPRKSCSPFLDNENWLKDLGLELVYDKNCPYGPSGAVSTYSNLQEYKCQNGNSELTGNTLKGDLKSETTCYVCKPQTSQACSSSNGTGTETCKVDGSGYGTCNLTACNSGYYLSGGVCKPQVCSPSSTLACEVGTNAHGIKTCNSSGSSYGDCTFTACNTGFVKLPDTKDVTNYCTKIICTPGSIDKAGCTEAPIAGGTYSRQCSTNGASYSTCSLTCDDGSAVRDGKCTTYNWSATTTWSTCSADCGGSQTQSYVCVNNFGETVADSKCTSAKPVVTRICDAKNQSWQDGYEVISPSTREVCPGLYLGYIEKIFQQPISYSCVNHEKVKSLGDKVLKSTTNYCSAIQPARCSHDSLSITESLRRLDWMKACQNQIPVVKTFFDIIGGADQLSMYLNDTSSSLYGKARPRPLYVTFSTTNNAPWIAPKTFDSKNYNCTVPADLKVFGICTSSCYTPDQRLLFDVAGEQKYIPILEAINQNQQSIVTLGPDSVLEKLIFTTTPIAHFVSELVDTNHKILIFKTQASGKLSVTFNHPLVASDGVIREASDFKVGDQLVRADGNFDEIISIEEIVYPGKVHNVLPYGETTSGNILVAEGFLSGSAYFQNDGVNYLNQQILRSNLLDGVDLSK